MSVPHPARYALYKLIVYGERKGRFTVKPNKDLLQAGSLLARLQQTRAGQVDEAWTNLKSRGNGWVDRVKHGRDALAKVAPELAIQQWLAL